MSTIVAVRKERSIAIAGDSQTGIGDLVLPGSMRLYPRKIHNIAGAYIGIVGSTAHHSVLRSLANSQPDMFNFQSADAVFETLRAIYPLLRDEYYLLAKEDHQDQEYESSQMDGLIISKAGLFSFESYREVSEFNSFWATGSGREYALGALDAIYETAQSAKAIAEIAVRAACKFDSGSGLPLESFDLELAT
jgi:ATP-dependent protease HslVU (ClpYQ) peptidase subunit